MLGIDCRPKLRRGYPYYDEEEDEIGLLPKIPVVQMPPRVVYQGNPTELRQVFQGAITGSITSLVVPQVEAGEYIDIDISYNAYNPGGSFWNWWKIFVVAKDSLGNKELVKDVDVKSDSFDDSGTWRLWRMPSQSIQLEIRLYGHDEIVPWDWDWWP